MVAVAARHLHRRVARLLLPEVPLLDDARHLLVHRLLVVVAVEVHLHLVAVDELRLAQRLLELVGPHLARLLDVRRDLEEDHVLPPQRPLDPPPHVAERAHLVLVQLLRPRDHDLRVLRLHQAVRHVVGDDRRQALVVLEERERPLLEGDVGLLPLPHHPDLDVEPPLVDDRKLRHLEVLDVALVVARHLDGLEAHRPPLPGQVHLAAAEALGVEDLEDLLLLLLLRQRRVLALLHVQQLLVREVRARVLLEDLRRRAHLHVRAADLPRLAEALHPQHGAVEDAVLAVVLEHAHERLRGGGVEGGGGVRGAGGVREVREVRGARGAGDDAGRRRVTWSTITYSSTFSSRSLSSASIRSKFWRKRSVLPTRYWFSSIPSCLSSSVRFVTVPALSAVDLRRTPCSTGRVLERAAHVEPRLADLRHLERPRVRELLEQKRCPSRPPSASGSA